MADDGATDEEKKRAEAEAEARRQRILEKSKARMEKVSGLQAEADTEDEDTKTSSAARMQAMRRRRFKKGAKAKEESPGETATEDATTELVGEAKTEEAPPAASETESKAAPEEAKQTEPVKSDSSEKSDEPVPKPTTEAKKEEAPKEEDATATTTTAAEDTTTAKKKYKGVAKMRREKMLQKKKEDEAKAAEEEAKNPASQSPAVQARHKKRLKQPTLPIIMYLVTTFLLFLAGLDVGLQHADEGILVNRDFAPSQFSLQNLNPWGGKSARIKDLVSDAEIYSSNQVGEHDEFGTVDDTVDANYVPNIDPIFRVDLDELTRGPGVVNQMARGAVKIHRLILFLVWELPLQFFSLPRQLFQYPPVMCLVALIIRQLVGKIVLGAKLPDTIEEDVRNNKEITDVLTMIKNAVANTVTGTFPTAVSVYEGFKFLKADMYVMLCGVFVGLLYSTWTLGNAGGLPPLGMEEPIEDIIPEPDVPVDEVVTGSLAEEL